MLQIMEEESAQGVENALSKLARDGNVAAREALIQRGKGDLLDDDEKEATRRKSQDKNMSEDGEDKEMDERGDHSRSARSPRVDADDGGHHIRRSRSRSRSRSYDRHDGEGRDRKKKKKKDKDRSDRKKDKKKKKKEKGYGTLFKSTKESTTTASSYSSGPAKPSDPNVGGGSGGGAEEGSEEYWNAERAKLGLAPLKK